MTRLYPILSARCCVVRDVRSIAITALLVLAAAAPAQAAVTMIPLKDCYVSDGLAADKRERIFVHATGFTPQAALALNIDGGAVEATGKADAFGAADAEVPAPFQGFGQRPFTLVVAEF